MKTLQRHQFVAGLLLGFLLAILVGHLPRVAAEDAKKEAITQEELDKHLDEILTGQKEVLKHLETVATQARFLKVSSGK